MPAPRSLHRLLFLAGFVVLLDVAVLVLALSRRASDDETVADRTAAARAGEGPAAQPPAPLPPRAPLAIARDPSRVSAAPAPPRPAFDPDGLQLRRFERVSRALELLRFPPDSRPLRPEMTDLLHPGARFEAPQRLTEELSFLFTASTYALGPSTPVLATLEVFRGKGDDARSHVPLDLRACTLSRFAQPDYLPVATSLALNDDGEHGDTRAGDGVYSLAFSPSAWPDLATRNGLVRLDVVFGVEGQSEAVRASLDFRLTGTPPAIFLGVTKEELTPDGLTLGVQLDVRSAGRYVVQGLLFDSGGRPIGVATARPSLEAGRAVVPLLYWGLLFHDAHAVAPFTFRTVTGYRLPEAGELERSDMATWEGPYQTRTYALGELSDKEHESASKSRKIQALGDLSAQEPVRGAGPAPE